MTDVGDPDLDQPLGELFGHVVRQHLDRTFADRVDPGQQIGQLIEAQRGGAAADVDRTERFGSRCAVQVDLAAEGGEVALDQLCVVADLVVRAERADAGAERHVQIQPGRLGEPRQHDVGSRRHPRCRERHHARHLHAHSSLPASRVPPPTRIVQSPTSRACRWRHVSSVVLVFGDGSHHDDLRGA